MLGLPALVAGATNVVGLSSRPAAAAGAWLSNRHPKIIPAMCMATDSVGDSQSEPNEYAAGTIKGAVNIPMGELANKIGSLPADQPIVFICSTGARSGEAYDTAKLLRADLNVYFLDARVRYAGDGTFSIVL